MINLALSQRNLKAVYIKTVQLLISSVNLSDRIDFLNKKGNIHFLATSQKRKVYPMNRLKFTVLRRIGGQWESRIVERLQNGLRTETYHLAAKPEYLVLSGEYSRRQILDGMGGAGWVGEPLQVVEGKSLREVFDNLQ
jgi:hypothetical protein